MDALPPPPPAAMVAPAPGDIFPRDARERELCARASHTDWLYLGGLLALDVAALWVGSTDSVKFADSTAVRFSGPAMIGLTWGATLGGGYLALPKCDMQWVGESPREGGVRSGTTLAISLAMLAGATAPILNAIAISPLSDVPGSTFEREMQVVTAAVAGFGGALLPYLLPPRTWSAAQELDHLRVGKGTFEYAFSF